MLVLNRSAMEEVLPMNEVIEALAAGFRELKEKGAQIPTRFPLEIGKPKGVVLFMPAHLPHSRRLGVKVVSVFPENPTLGKPTIYASYLLQDAATGELLALMEAGSLTGIRTGAASALASRYLARADSRCLGVIGAGFQSVYQARALLAVRPLEEVWVYDAVAAQVERFRQALGGSLKVHQARSAAEAVQKSDILVTATTSATPVFADRDLREGTHINAIGAFRPDTREIDFATVKRARVVVDTYEGALAEAGELLIPIHQGQYRKEDIQAELAQLVCGEKTGRQNPAEITLFKSVGHALEDVVVAHLAYRRALAQGKGLAVDW
jgi:ornithine cyclodeaminase/alanine dehydrogenase-like protein (mu-crystallin family)